MVSALSGTKPDVHKKKLKSGVGSGVVLQVAVKGGAS